MVEKIGAGTGTKVLDAVAILENVTPKWTDGLHPSQAANQEIARRLVDTLQARIAGCAEGLPFEPRRRPTRCAV